MKFQLLLLMVVSIVIMAGCSSKVELTLDKPDSADMMTSFAIGSNCTKMSSGDSLGIGKTTLNNICESKCNGAGYKYDQWKCSNADFICVCNK